MSKKSVKWEAGAYMWITVASPDRDPFRFSDEHLKDCGLFYEWLAANKIRFKTNRIGGGQFDGLIELDEWPKVEKWLNENGYEQGSTALSKETEDDYWAEYEQMGG